MSKELSEMCPLGEKMAKIWLKLQENGEKKSQMAKVMAKEKYILARTLDLYKLCRAPFPDSSCQVSKS